MQNRNPYLPEEITSSYQSSKDLKTPNLSYHYAEEFGRIHMTETLYSTELEEHTHDFVEIVCIAEGSGIHIIDGETFRVRRGDICLIDYGMRHTFQPLSKPFRWINCIFRPQFLGESYPALNSALQLLSYLHDHKVQPLLDPALCRRNLRLANWDAAVFFEDMLNEYCSQSPDYTAVLEHMLSILLIRIAREFFTENVRSDTPFDRVLPDIIRRLNQSQPGSISEKELADQYYMSQSAFSTHFRKRMGCSYLEYIINLRIRHACALLLATDYMIGEIQTCCGYSDSKSFYRAFRRYTGMTPLEYRNAHQNLEGAYEKTIV